MLLHENILMNLLWPKDILVNIGSGNGFLPDGTKPLSESISTYHQYSDIHRRTISQEISQPSITKISLEIIHKKNI